MGKALVVDDSKMTRMVLGRILRELDFEADWNMPEVVSSLIGGCWDDQRSSPATNVGCPIQALFLGLSGTRTSHYMGALCSVLPIAVPMAECEALRYT
jgi:hypothetical protein